jgi:tRNA(Ile)-lysidine synthase
MDVRHFHRRLFEAARELILPGARVVCAVSGGADSIAMLHGLCAVNGLRDRRWLLSVAHLDHQIREDSSCCAAFVRETADKLGVECRVEEADVPAIRTAEGGSLEDTARRVRYEFLRRAAEDAGASVVAVAHHADDQAETVLHRLVRGTGVQGLGGMRPRRPIAEGSPLALVRPLLGFRRAELREYVVQQGAAYREDVTNADAGAATRNRIRHEILPLLETQLNPKAVEAVVRLADQVRDAAQAIRWAAERALTEIRIDAERGEVRLKASVLAAFPAALRSHIVRIALEEIGAEFGDLGQERIEAAAELSGRDRRRRMLELPGGIVVERRGDHWVVRSQRRAGGVDTRNPLQVEQRHS